MHICVLYFKLILLFVFGDFGIAFVKKCLFGIRAYSGKRDGASAAEEQITTLSSLLLCWGKCLIAHFIVLD